MSKRPTTNPDIIGKQQTAKFVFSKESLKKKFRWSEFLAEKLITFVAFSSIAIIVLIFIFVFRETLPIFRSPKSIHNTAISKQTATADKQEVYGGDNSEQTSNNEQQKADLKPETYGDDNSEQKTNKELLTKNEVADSSITKSIEQRATNKLLPTQNSQLRTLASRDWQPVSDNPRYGLLPLLIGTIKITIISLLFAGPIGILAALFSSAFAPRWLREIIKPAVELLAGFPSVVIGFFALMVMATILQDLFGYASRLNAFVGGIAMGLAAIPIIFTISEDAMTAIPKSYTEASLALGANKWQTALFVVLPAAIPGIFAALLLGIGRVFGETMIVLMATGNASLISANPFESVRTFAATIGAEMGEVVFGDLHYSVLFLIGSLLFIFTFVLNAIAEFYVRGKLMKRFQGKS